MPKFAQIRRMEAVSFRSFPSTSTMFDGTWAIRLSAGHPAKRLNSVNPLDPHDNTRLEERIHLAEKRFHSFGRPLVFRLTPLAPLSLQELLKNHGWSSFEESVVMVADLKKLDLSHVMDQLPLKDAGPWIDAFIELSHESHSLKPGFAEIIGATEPETGLFIHSEERSPMASVVRCVHDRDVVGIFDVVTNPHLRRRGNGRAIMESALKWAQQRGATSAWVQVVADNLPAISLYESLGFSELYRYKYWQPHKTEDGQYSILPKLGNVQ